jgi:hypothetical protein
LISFSTLAVSSGRSFNPTTRSVSLTCPHFQYHYE